MSRLYRDGRDFYKQEKNIDTGRPAVYIEHAKVPAFIKLMERIVAFHGGVVRATEAVGLHHKTYYRFINDKKLSDVLARKILKHYQEVVK